MRLKQIKLSGFKSFVDPTVLDVPGQLIGVVGPNGCGKSNIMDAVRWVLGESRANELRGESMQDVIFSGSADRKPAARASVELVFDNSMGRIGGSWGVYAEVSVKRVLTRDGQSIYSINQQTVRRRDVHDLFLGTGLGPRAYAIIGQGTISRIIESKPEELRIFLEEAAGISRYKERRRDTENRLADTRENLTRVEDILRELDTNIARLEVQAKQAEKFRELDADRHDFQGLLWLARRNDALEQQRRASDRYRGLELKLDAELASLRETESALESARRDAGALADQLHAAQARYYEINSEVAKFESEIRFLEASKRQANDQLEALAQQQRKQVSEREQAEQMIGDSRQRLEALTVSVQDQSERVQQLAAQQQGLDLEIGSAQQQLEALREQLDQVRRERDAAQIRRQAAHDQGRQLDQGLLRNRQALDRLQPLDPDARHHQGLKLQAAEDEEARSGELEASLQARVGEAQAALSPNQENLRRTQSRHAEIEAKLQALVQLEARLSDESKMRPWLQAKGWQDNERFWQGIRVEAGWEAAVEAALRERLEGIALPSMQSLETLAVDAPPNKQVFFRGQLLPGQSPVKRGALETSNSLSGFRSMRELLQCADEQRSALLDRWLEGAFVADDLASALKSQSQIPLGQRLYTAQGHCIERDSVACHAADQAHEGRLARKRETEALQKNLRAQQLLLEQARQDAQAAERSAQDLAQQLGHARQAHLQATRVLAQVRLETERMNQTQRQHELEGSRLRKEIQDLEQEAKRQQQIETQGSEQIEQLDKHRVLLDEGFRRAQQASASAQQQLVRWRESFREAERQLDAYHYDLKSVTERLANASQRREALEESMQALAEQERLLRDRIGALRDDQARGQLDQSLALRIEAEASLSRCRADSEAMHQQCRAREEQRMLTERRLDPLREGLSSAALDEQAAKTTVEQCLQMMLDAKLDEAALRLRADEQHIAMKVSTLQTALQRITQAMDAMGAVNLAALDELQHARERQGFLRSQCADLSEAMQTLEGAIHKIDRETRDLLKQTYDQVNQNFGHFFPKLFGGGDAKLLLTGEEILDAGIQVTAHPPGKRNSSIHLLSGGEKALTAIALVFAIFQLNPAPFCLLDEVDAPLDDANTERYCDMVRSMSDQTQFLFITHNKVAMELAQQLVGVTMQERGVSRLVAVDLEAAADFAQAA
ncbi:MAG: chromosome segregation protein SMC [Betaproteobacteria bacterium]|nr:chromosome segregation protein SMC [Betaproteobacteria bacterium]